MKRDKAAEYAEKYKVSERTIYAWDKEGIDLDNPQAVEEYRALNPDKKAQGKSAILEDKARKLKAEADIKEREAEMKRLALDEMRGSLVPVEDAIEAARIYAASVKAALNRLQGEMPPLLCGLTEAEIQKVLEGKFEDALRQLADEE